MDLTMLVLQYLSYARSDRHSMSSIETVDCRSSSVCERKLPPVFAPFVSCLHLFNDCDRPSSTSGRYVHAMASFELL